MPDADLDLAFRAYLAELNLSGGTIDVYARDVQTAGGTRAGLLALLKGEDRAEGEELAPRTLRHVLAAARHWAQFQEDDKLEKALKKLRLPPARRKTAKVPLTRAEWHALIDAIDQATLQPGVQVALGVMIMRGLRVGDVLRLKRGEVAQALASGTLSYEGKGRRRLEFKVLKTYKRWLQQIEQLGRDRSWKRVEDLVAVNGSAAGRRTAAKKAIERALTHVGAQVGILGLYPHRLRRTYAVMYLQQLQGDPEAIMKLTQHMQWASMATALEYVDHARGAELDTVAEEMFER